MSQPAKVKGGLAAVLGGTEGGSLQIAVQMHDHTMMLAGVPANKFYFDAKTNIETSVSVSRYYGFDTMAAGLDLYNIEIEALGGKMIYGEYSMPTIDFRDPLIKKPEDLEKLKNKKIDFKKDGRFPFILELSELNLEYGFGTGLVCAPFSMAVGMRGFPALIKDMRKNPKFAHDLFKYIVDDVLTPWIKVQNEVTGNLMAIGADAWACIPNLSVKEMMDWVVPYNLRLMQKTKKFGVLTMSISGDYCEERIEKFDPKILHGSFDVEIASQGVPLIFLGMGRWHEYPLESVREYTAKYREQGKKVSIMAGVNARLLRDGPVDKIIDTIKRYINTFARDHDLTVFLANIPADTPSDHIHAAVTAVHTYGKLPIADNLDKIELKVPKKEPYKEWRKKNA
jgi:uroporphyrinogen-III decarboxylase